MDMVQQQGRGLGMETSILRQPRAGGSLHARTQEPAALELRAAGAGMGRRSPAPARLRDGARGRPCRAVPARGALPEQPLGAWLRLHAAIMFDSPEAASCRLTLTNRAQKLHLGGCKLFSSSGEKNAP